MVDNKKEMEREELHRAIWAIADELRGAVDGWDFEFYVLGPMFYRYTFDNLSRHSHVRAADLATTLLSLALLPLSASCLVPPPPLDVLLSITLLPPPSRLARPSAYGL